jgi:ribosomal protein S18 acetylase RimI-like enzyme
MELKIRRPLPSELFQLAQLYLMAGHGTVEVIYQNLLPNLSVEEILVKRRIRPTGTSVSIENWWVAILGTEIAGGLVAYPIADRAQHRREDLLTADRSAIFQPVAELLAQAPDSFYINVIAVFPAHRNRGVGNALLEHARTQAIRLGFNELSLFTFEEDQGLIRYYEKLGFQIIARSPVAAHPQLTLSGHLALMTRQNDTKF